MKIIKYFLYVLFTIAACQAANMGSSPIPSPIPPEPVPPKDPASWKPVGPALFSEAGADSNSLIIDQGVPYVAYMDYSENQRATVKKFNGTDWEFVGTPGISFRYSTSLSFAVKNAVPYLGSRSSIDIRQTVEVMFFDGASWAQVYLKEDAVTPNPIKLAADSEYIYMVTKGGKYLDTVMVYRLEGSTWTLLGNALEYSTKRDLTSLSLKDGIPYLFFQAHLASSTPIEGGILAQKISGKTENLGKRFEILEKSEKAEYISSAFKGGELYVAYENPSDKRAVVKKFNGSTWETVGKGNPSSGGVKEIQLASGKNTLYLAYVDEVYGDRATVMKLNGDKWEPVASPGFTKGSVRYISLAVSEDTPYLAYSDPLQDRKLTVMKYD